MEYLWMAASEKLLHNIKSSKTFTYSKPTIETLENGVKS